MNIMYCWRLRIRNYPECGMQLESKNKLMLALKDSNMSQEMEHAVEKL